VRSSARPVTWHQNSSPSARFMILSSPYVPFATITREMRSPMR
jgi:hypothetical protein